MRRILILPTALILTGLALTGCSAAKSIDVSGGSPAVQPAAPMANDSALTESATGTKTETDREVITTGYVTITVDDPMTTAADAIRITESVGGRVDGRSEYAPADGNKGSATLTLRLPADSLTATLDKLRELGTVQEVSLNSTDVTMETRDLDARITALKASVDRLLTLLESATETSALIELETAISDRQAQLESLESQRRYYTDQVSLSTVTLNLVSEYTAPPAIPHDFGSGIVAGWNAFIGFFAGLVVVFGVLLPWLVLAGIITTVIIVLVRARRRRATAAAPAVAAAPESVDAPTEK
jgi:hypothetical protein